MESRRTTENPAAAREPDLVTRAAAWLQKVTDELLDQLSARSRGRSDYRQRQDRYPQDELIAVALVLRVLSKPAWTAEDLDAFDANFRLASFSDAFPDEFEEARHRMQRYVQQAREQLVPHARRSMQYR